MAVTRLLALLLWGATGWMVGAAAPPPAHATTDAQQAAIRDENELHRRNRIDLSKQRADAKADRDIAVRNCRGEHECVRAAERVYRDRLIEIANQGTREEARHRKALLDISKGEFPGASPVTPATGDVFRSSGAGAGTGTAQNPFKLEAVHDAPLDWIPDTLNTLVDGIPDGAQRLQAASNWSNDVKRPFEERWTKNPAGGITEVGEFVALKGVGKVVGPIVAQAATKVGESPVGKALAAAVQRLRRASPAAGGAAPKAAGLPAFRAEVDQATRTAAQRFAAGTQGGSVKGLSRQIEGKTLQEIDEVMAQKGGGWRPPDAEGVVRSNDGAWTRIDGTGTGPGGAFPQRFYVNQDGGVLRIKPNGMPGSTLPIMLKPHAGVSVQKFPGLKPTLGGLDFDNEAFKVVGDAAVPKWPRDMAVPPGINPVNGDPGFEKWLLDTGWSTLTHISLK